MVLRLARLPLGRSIWLRFFVERWVDPPEERDNFFPAVISVFFFAHQTCFFNYLSTDSHWCLLKVVQLKTFNYLHTVRANNYLNMCMAVKLRSQNDGFAFDEGGSHDIDCGSFIF